MTPFDRLAGLAVAAAATIGVTWLSQIPVASGDTAEALLRLAWRARPERIETCIAQSPEALAALPPHMRQTVICEGTNASYRLDVRRDDALVASRIVEPGGLRRDRPLYVFDEIPLPAGDVTIRVSFVRTDAPGADGIVQDSEDRDDDDSGRSRRRREELTEAVAASLTWEQRLHFAPGQVRVISYDPERRELFEVRED